MSGGGSQGARVGGDILIRQSRWGSPLGFGLCLAFVAAGVWMIISQFAVAVGIVWVAIGLLVAVLFVLNHAPGGIVLSASERGLVYRTSLSRIDAPWNEILGAEIELVDDGEGNSRPALIIGIRNREQLIVGSRFARHLFAKRKLDTDPPWEEILWLGYNSSWIWEPREVCRFINERLERP